MLENWVWKEESLRLMSKHYKDGTPLPKEMLHKLVASKNANAGGFNLRQVFLATVDGAPCRVQEAHRALDAQLALEGPKTRAGGDSPTAPSRLS